MQKEILKGILTGYKERGLFQTTAFKKYPCPYYVFFIKNKEHMDIVFKSKSKPEREWYYLSSEDYKIIYDIDSNHRPFLNIKYEHSKAKRVRRDRLYSIRYMVTENGIIISRNTCSIMSVSNSDRYIKILLSIKGEKKTKSVHRLVAHAFCPRPERHLDKDYNELEVNHIDGVKDNNHYTNLEWITHSENMKHAADNNLRPVGEEHGKSIFTNEDVKSIRNEWSLKDKNYYVKEHALKYNIYESTMHYILKNISYYDPNYKPDMNRFGDRNGEDHRLAKLTNQQVKEIRDDYISNLRPYKYYMDKYNISKNVIVPIINNRNYIDPNYIVPVNDTRRKLTFEDATWIRQHKHDNPDTLMKYYAEKYNVSISIIDNVLKNNIYKDPNFNFIIAGMKITDDFTVKLIRQDYSVNPDIGIKGIATKYNISKTGASSIIYNESRYDPEYIPPVKRKNKSNNF